MKIYRPASSSESVPPLAYEPDSAYVPPLSLSSIFNSIPSSSDDDSEDDNPPPPLEIVPYTPPLRRWVRSTRDVAGSLVGDLADQRRTHSQFEKAYSLLA